MGVVLSFFPVNFMDFVLKLILVGINVGLCLELLLQNNTVRSCIGLSGVWQDYRDSCVESLGHFRCPGI